MNSFTNWKDASAKHQSFFELNQESGVSLYVNEIENAIDSLETAVTFLSRTDNMKWKWLAIALDHCFYSFCIAALSRHPNDVLSRGPKDDVRTIAMGNDPEKRSRIVRRSHSRAYTIAWVDSSSLPHSGTKLANSENHLIGFWTALARVQDSYYWMGRCSAEALFLTEDELLAIEWMHNEVRSGLTHFRPQVASFAVEKIKAASLHTLRAIRFLAFDSKAVYYSHREEAKERIIESIKTLFDYLKV